MKTTRMAKLPYTLTNSWLEISKSAINHNISIYKNIINHNTFAAVIKGNGYGHGLLEMGSICQENDQVDWICVAHLSEAIALRKNGITKPILVFGYADTNIQEAVGLNITFMVDNSDYAKLINEIGKCNNYIFTIHAKIDTGLSRLGVASKNAISFIQELQTLPCIKIDGIYSHFAASDIDLEYTKQQLNEFVQCVQNLSNKGITFSYIHMSNSAAIKKITFPPIFNFFRSGIGMYGISPYEPTLKPALTWKTYIAETKTIPSGSYVSYAFEYQTKRETRIAILPIGYSDGYDVRFSNKISVLVNKKQAPIIGRVAMNMTMIDVTDIETKMDDEVILLGNYQDIGIHDLAQKGNIKNPREILTKISPYIKRILVP